MKGQATRCTLAGLALLILMLVPLLYTFGWQRYSQVTLEISRDGQFLLEGRRVAEQDLKDALKRVRARGVPVELLVVGPGKDQSRYLGIVIAATQFAGVERIAHIGEPGR